MVFAASALAASQHNTYRRNPYLSLFSLKAYRRKGLVMPNEFGLVWRLIFVVHSLLYFQSIRSQGRQ